MLARRVARAAASVADGGASATPPRVFLNAVVERAFLVHPPEPAWRADYEARADAWRAAYQRGYPKEFHAKLDPREAPRASYLAALERVLAEHADAPNPHDDDARSLRRRQTRRLYLLLRKGGAWTVPRAELAATDGSASMRSALLALQRDQLGPTLKALHLSRAPIAHSAAAVGGAAGAAEPAGGATDFYFKLKHMVGNVVAAGGVEDYAWLTKEEAVARLADGPAKAVLARVFLD
jgi:hypothetical protein